MNTEQPKISDYILEVNNQYIIANKPAGMPSQSDQTKDTALSQLMDIYAKQKIHIVNRLDRAVSGLVVFTKKPNTTKMFISQFKEGTAFKSYLALVEQQPPKKKDKLQHYLTKNPKTRKAYVGTPNSKNSKEAILEYELLHSFDHYHLLKVRLYNGRFHQIRAQLSAIGCPIKGDVKYGARRKNKDRSIHLHAYKIEFKHPIDHSIKSYTAPLPDGDGLWKAVKSLLEE